MANLRKFYFDTGVTRYGHNPPVPLCKGQEWSPNGVKVIPFYCKDVPEGAEFMFGCDDIIITDIPNVIYREILNSSLISKYAYFKLKDDKIQT